MATFARCFRHVALAPALVLATACGSTTPASVLARPPEYAPEGQAKCGVAKSQAEPLVVEWPAAARAKLEALAKRGLVTVRYTGCEMEVLAQCRVSGAYTYTPTTRQRDRVAIRNDDELYASLPLGAASLEGKLHTAGQLNVTMTIVGTYQIEREQVRRDELEGGCARATHVVTALSAGAFVFTAGADAEVGGGGTGLGAGAGVRSGAQREVLNQAGEESACAAATAEDTAPPFGCGALLRVEVAAIAPAKPEVVPAPPEEPLASSEQNPEEPDIGEPKPEEPKPEEAKPEERKPEEPKPEAAGPEESRPIGPYTEADRGTGPSGPNQPPDERGSWVPVIVYGGLLVVGVVGGIIAAVVAANQEDAPQPKVAPAGLGTVPVHHPTVPVLRW